MKVVGHIYVDGDVVPVRTVLEDESIVDGYFADDVDVIPGETQPTEAPAQ